MIRLSPRQTGALLGVALAAAAAPAAALDWSGVPATRMVLLYPGQASWEWALSKNDHSAAPKFREGKNCKACHIKEEEQIGNALASGARLEKTPVPGKRGSIPLDVRFAQDGKRLYVQMEWPDRAPLPVEKSDKEFPIKATMMMDDGKVLEFARAGCWAICHDDVNGMPSAEGGKDLHKYLARSRAKLGRSGGGDALKPQGDLDTMFNDGQYIEYWQAKLKPGAPAVPADGRALEKRTDNAKAVISAEAKQVGGKWVVEMSRPLVLGQPGHKDIVPGKVYTIGFAVHEDHANGRFHQVSLEYTFALDGEADIIVAKK